MCRRSPRGVAAALLTIPLLVVAAAPRADAGCNLIPAAEKTFPSMLGGVDSPITAPGKTVTIRLNPQCDGASPGFDALTPANNVVTLVFEPPGGGPTTDVVVSPVVVGDTLTLSFTMPDTTALLPPHGLAGPARIVVERNPGNVLAAEIGPLFQPTSTCDREPETLFQQLTVLPPANVVADLASGAATQIRATLDGSGSILVPLDHVLVLPAGPNAPIARFLAANSSIDAFTSAPGVPVQVPDQSFVRSFTLNGRALPPLLRVSDTGDQFFGTTDAEESVIRIARTDGMGGPAIYDFTDRLFLGQGPIVIDKVADGFAVVSGPAVPLDGLQSSVEAVAFARDESLEGDLNGDGDSADRVVQILDVGAGNAVPTGRAALSVTTGAFSVPSIVTAGPLTAFLESEADQGNVDRNGDGDTLDGILRVYDRDGTELTTGDVAASHERVIGGRALAISGSLVFHRTPRSVAFVEAQINGMGGVDGLGMAQFIVVSPDGADVYVVTPQPRRMAHFTRNAATGALSFVGVIARTTCAGGSNAGQPCVNNADCPGGTCSNPDATSESTMVMSPDGQHLYVATRSAGFTADVTLYSRNVLTGALVAEVSQPLSEAAAPFFPFVALSPDGAHVYAGAGGDVDVFARDTGTGLLTPSTTVTGVASAGVVSPDGRNVYTIGGVTALTLTTYARDTATGDLTPIQTDNVFNGGTAIGTGIVVSPDGKHVAVSLADASNFSFGQIHTFSRDPNTGIVAPVEVQSNGVGAVTGLGAVREIALSPDGGHLYAAAIGNQAITVFSRNPSSGELTFVVDAPGLPLGGSAGVAISPADGHAYVAADNALRVFRNDGPMLQAFDTDTQTLRPNASMPASAAAVAAQRAAVLRPEESGTTASDFNGDGDTNDQVAFLYDGVLDTFAVSLEVAANRVAMSDQLVALTVPEASQGATPRNGDGDTLDDVLAVFAIGGAPPATNVGVAADTIAVSGNAVVFTTPEAAEGPGGIGCAATDPVGGCDLNGDGDAGDRVLRVYDGTVVELGRAAEEFVVGGTLVAFRTREAAQNAADLNGDGDTDDGVMFVYDIAKDVLIPTGQAAIPCTLPGCDPFQPYSIKGELVSFITQEADQGPGGIGCQPTMPPGGCDLNGDGDGTDIVMQAFNVRTGERFVFDLGDGCGSTQITRLVTTYIDGTIVYVEKSEAELGQDLNGDLDTNDCVHLLVGDVDEDGTFDDQDTCAETANPDQDDADLDGLGNVCDPNAYCGDLVPAAPPLAPADSAACQQALGKAAATYLKKRAKAERSCLDKIAKGTLAGDADALCRGGFAGGAAIPPLDAKTAKKLAKAGEKFAVKVAKTCSDADLAPLAACADTLAELPACVLPAYGTVANDVTTFAFGAVGAIADKAERLCQSTVAKASVSYVSAITKAMQDCLDKLNKGDLSGDAQTLCLGSLTPGGIVPPTHAATAKKLAKAETKLRDKIAGKCAGGELATLQSCGDDPVSAGDCLACTHWARGVAAIQSAYGP